MSALRFESCMCGGELSAPDGDWDAIRDAVVAHQETLLHVVYRASHGLDAPVRSGAESTPGLSARRDVSGWPTAAKFALRRTRLVHR